MRSRVGLDVAVHHRRRRGQADRVRACVTTSIHSAVVMRPGAMRARTLVVEHLGRGAGQRAEAGVLQLLEVRGGSDAPRSSAPYFTSSGEKACRCSVGRGAP